MIQSIWIVTIGNSDIQLTRNNYWNQWYPNIEEECHYLCFEPAEVRHISFDPNKEEDDEIPTYRIPARILGRLYETYSNPNEIDDHLCFPLLRNFVNRLNDEPDRVFVILTDQEHFFSKDAKERDLCPYWQDTCELKSLLKNIFERQFHISLTDEDWIVLQPKSQKAGLDDWNEVLEIVQNEFRGKLDKLDLAEDPTIYVSHQAGTPAISSAVQFVSLAMFGDRVKFLVSNEYNSELTGFVESSSYLRGIELQQAQKLLEDRYDYPGVKEVLQRQFDEVKKHRIDKAESIKIKYIEYLLDVAIQWNFAEFDDPESKSKKSKNKSENFKSKLLQHPDPKFLREFQERTKEENWWWTAYEAAWLGVIRLEQGNTVEAMFHSFRAVEGLLRKWVDKFYFEEIKQTKHPKYNEHSRWERTLRPYGEDLYLFLDIKRTINKDNNFDIWVFGKQLFKQRNNLFHQLIGLGGREILFDQWRSPNEPQWKEAGSEKWKKRVFECLNFIAKDDLPEGFSSLSLEKVSLMATIHEELKSAIARL